MKKIILLWAIILLGNIIYGQSYHYPETLQKIAVLKGEGAIINIKADYQIPAAHFFEKYQRYFGLGKYDEMREIYVSPTRNGKAHHRLQQYFQQIPVAGAQLILHEKNEKVYRVTGTIVSGLSLIVTPKLTEEEVIAIALNNSKADRYAWQSPSMEADLKIIRKDTTATYYPTPTLEIYDKAHTFIAKNYRLVYKISLSVIAPEICTEIFYVAADNGEIVHHITKKAAANIEVQAVTRYNGAQTITVDSLASNLYMFRSTSRGAGDGILTKSMNNEGDLISVPIENATDLYEADTYFDSDVIANSAHYGAEMTYDYYYYTHGRNSYNDQGTQLLSYVHTGQNMQNAFWNGSAMFYGDGVNNYPFTFITVCGHEITHGVTEYTANLVYQDEPGALNESFSDIFGVMVHRYATGQLQWAIGEELNSPFRDMSNPNRFEDPDTYLGNYWVFGTEDYGGVHTNCGVGNYWFYLLTVGGSGVNDMGTAYEVTGITPEKSELIAYSLLTEYLTPYSDYQEACLYSIEVAEDLFGRCSMEQYAVAQAWAAVGLGYPFSDSVIHITSVVTPVTDCALQNEELITLDLLYNSCDDTLRVGTQLFFKVQVNQSLDIFDTLVLDQDVAPGAFTVTLPRGFDFSVPGDYRLDISLGLNSDVYTSTYTDYRFTNRVYQNSDFGVSEIVAPTSSCHLDEQTPVTANIFFNVCDQTEPGDSVVISFTINGANKITEVLVLTEAMTSSDTIEYTFTQGGDFTLAAKNTLRVFTENSNDLNTTNNIATKEVYKPKFLNQISSVTFDQTGDQDYFYVDTNRYSNAYAYTLPDYSDRRVLKMTAKGDPMGYMNSIEFPSDENLWEYNKEMDSEANFCIDATDYQEFALAFNLKQTSGKDTYAMFLEGSIPDSYDLSYSSMLRLLVDNEPITETFIPNLASNDPFLQKVIDLTPYTGGVFMLTFQSKCLAANMTYYFQNFILDNVYIDNIALWSSVDIPCHQSGATYNGYIYPNPNNGKFILNIETSEAEEGLILISDITGRMVYRQPCYLNGGIQSMEINAGQLETGIYLMEMSTRKGKLVHKIVVQ